jgi:hypothetical protein
MLNFLIRIDSREEELTSIIPLINQISSLGNVRINILLDEGFPHYENWFGDNCHFYYVPEKKKKSLFGLHHFAANLHDVFNVDYFFDFISDFYSAFIGLAFRAKTRVGLQGGPKSYLYNYSLESFPGMFMDEKKLSVLKYVKEFEKDTVDRIETETKKEFEQCCVDMSLIQEDQQLLILEKFSECFDEIKLFGYIPSEIQEEVELGELSESYELFSEFENDFIEKISTFDLFVTPSLVKSQLALLKGIQTIYYTDKPDDLPNWSKMASNFAVIKFIDGEIATYGIGEERTLRIPTELEDYLQNFYSLRLEPS